MPRPATGMRLLVRKVRNLVSIIRNQAPAQLDVHYPDPPACEAGFVCGAPDFIGIGAQRCGTSWWYNLLLGHPGIYHSDYDVTPKYLNKERMFFNRFFNRPWTESDVGDYCRWFPRPVGMLCGEWTAHYGATHWAPRLLSKCVPGPKLLLLLRDPLERFVSGMNHTMRFTDTPTSREANLHYLLGLYAQHLENWFEYFDRESILVLQYEKCTANPQAELNRTFGFLGLEPVGLSEERLHRPRNVTLNKKFLLDDDHRDSLIAAYKHDVRRLGQLCPDLDMSLWTPFA